MRGQNDSSGKERMFCQAVAERELACQLMGHVQCEPRILQRLSRPSTLSLRRSPSSPLSLPALTRESYGETRAHEEEVTFYPNIEMYLGEEGT